MAQCRQHHRALHEDAYVSADDDSDSAPNSECLLTAAGLVTYRQTHALTRRPPLPEILYTASVLVHRCSCPVDVASNILAFAGLLVVSFEDETQEIVVSRKDMYDEYLRLAIPSEDALSLPAGAGVGQCVLLAVEWKSSGRVWTSELNSTYPHANAWLDVSIQRPEEKSASALATDIIASSATDDIAVDTSASTDWVEVARVCAVPTLRWSYKIRHHIRRFVNPLGLVQSVALGDAVCLVLRSEATLQRRNIWRSARVQVLFPLKLSDAFSSATVAFPDASAAGVDNW